MDLLEEIYTMTKRFPRTELYGLTSQIQRASTSVVSHIAEGQGRLTVGEWRQMLSQARGSLYEVEAQLLVAKRLQYIDEAVFNQVRTRASRVGVALAGLIRYVQRREQEQKARRPPVNPTTRPPGP